MLASLPMIVGRGAGADSEPTQRLMKIEGVGPVTATALVATVGDAKVFNNAANSPPWASHRDSIRPAASSVSVP